MKALLLNLDPLRFVALNALRPLSNKFCYRGPFLHSQACRYSGAFPAFTSMGQDKDTTLRSVRQRYQSHAYERLSFGDAFHFVPLCAGA